MRWKFSLFLILFCLFLPNYFGGSAGAQVRNKRGKRAGVKKTAKSVSRTSTESQLPPFAQSPLPKGNYAFVVPRCSDDRQVLVFNIYRTNLFSQKFMLVDGKLKIILQNGSLSGDLDKADKAEDVYLLNKIAEEVNPTFMQLYPGEDRMLSTIVLTKDKFTSDQMYKAYDQVKRHLTFLGFSVGFASECNHLFLPEGQSPSTEQTQPPSNH